MTTRLLSLSVMFTAAIAIAAPGPNAKDAGACTAGAIDRLHVQVYQTAVGAQGNCYNVTRETDLPTAGTTEPSRSPSGAWSSVGAHPKGGFKTWVRALGAGCALPGVWSDVTRQVAWIAEDPSATGTTVDARGLVATGATAGAVFFVAQLPSGVRSQTHAGTPGENGRLDVVDGTLANIRINAAHNADPARPQFGPDPVYLALGRSLQLKVAGQFNGTPADGYCIASDPVYSSNNMTRVSVDAAGLLTTPASTGTATITARMGSTITDTIPVEVGPAEVTSVQVQPVSVSLAGKASAQLRATVRHSDGSERDVTEVASWSASPSGIVVIAGATKGLIRPVATGTAVVKACFDSVFISNSGLHTTETRCAKGATITIAP